MHRKYIHYGGQGLVVTFHESSPQNVSHCGSMALHGKLNLAWLYKLELYITVGNDCGCSLATKKREIEAIAQAMKNKLKLTKVTIIRTRCILNSPWFLCM